MPPDMDAMAGVVAQAIKAAVGQVLERVAAVEARLSVLGDVRDRVVALETKSAAPLPTDVAVIELRDRLVALETKAAQLAPAVLTTLTPDVELRDRIVTLETKAAQPLPAPDLGDVRDRLVVLETRMPTKAFWDELSTARLQSVEWQAKRDDSVRDEITAIRERLAVLETKPALPGPPGEAGAPGKDGLAGKDGAAGLSFEGVYQEGQSYEKGHLVTWAGSSWHCNEATTSKPGDGSKAWTLMVKRGRDGKDGINGRDLAPVVKVGA